MLFSYSSACLREWMSASLSIWFSSVSSLTAKACLWLVISKWVCEKFASSDWLRYSTMELSRFLCISFPSLYNVSATLLARLLSCCICWRRDSVFPSSPWRWCTSSLYSSWISRPRSWIRLAPCSASAPRRSSSSIQIVAPSSSLEANINSAWYSVTSFVEYINRLLRMLISLNTCWLCPRRYSVNLVSMSLMTWSLEAAYISDCTTFSLKVWHCSLSSSMIAIGSLLPRASVDLLLALISLDSLPGLSSTALGVLCSVGVLLGDRWLRRAFPLRATSRADLGVLVVDALRCLEVIFCHPDFVVLVDLSPLSAVPGEDCEIPSAGAAALPSKVNCVSPLSPCIFAMMVLIGFHDRSHPTLVNSTQVLRFRWKLRALTADNLWTE